MVAFALVSCGLLGRYEVGVAESGVFRIDRFSGEVTRCVYSAQDEAGRLRMVCGEVPEYVRRPVSAAPSSPSIFEVMHPEAHAKQEAEMKRALAQIDEVIAKQEGKARGGK